MKTYKNEIVLQTKDGPINCGDPFVMRFNGRYYLYPSTEHWKTGINCFVSDNLVDWEHAGVVCDYEFTKNAYAPEVIYANEKFYLCTSPGGNGHYIFVADNPLGPFEPITGNIAQMIDGSFFIDHDEQLYFSRADHKGIAIMKMDENANLSTRVDLNAELYGWTEGPLFIYNDGFYYMTYCGNHLVSRGYRIEYGTSKSLLGDYRRGKNNPMLVTTHDEFHSIGHSSTVLAPDLDGYYIVYHRLEPIEDKGKGDFFRTYNVDRLSFNGRQMSSQLTYFPIEAPRLPDYYEWLDESCEKFEYQGDFLLSNENAEKSYTAEYTFKNQADLKVIFDYQDASNYLMLVGKDYQLRLIEVVNGEKRTIDSIATKIDFTNFHTIRIKAKDRMEIYLDNMLKFKVNRQAKGGKIGYKDVEGSVMSFTAFTNDAFNDRDKKLAKNLPCYVESTQDLAGNELVLDPIDELYAIHLEEGKTARFLVSSHRKEDYGIDLFCRSDNDALIECSFNGESQTIRIQKNENPYEYCKRHLTTMSIDGKGEFTIKVLEGSIDFKFLDIYSLNLKVKDILTGFEVDGKALQAQTKARNVLLKNPEGFVKEISVDFMLQDGNVDEHSGGILLNVTNYSDFPAQVEHSYCGYYISVNDWLLKVDRASYGLSRIYDKPIKIGINQPHNLRVTLEDTKISVYVDGKLAFSCYDDYVYNYGMSGLYTSKVGNVVFSNLKITYK